MKSSKHFGLKAALMISSILLLLSIGFLLIAVPLAVLPNLNFKAIDNFSIHSFPYTAIPKYDNLQVAYIVTGAALALPSLLGIATAVKSSLVHSTLIVFMIEMFAGVVLGLVALFKAIAARSFYASLDTDNWDEFGDQKKAVYQEFLSCCGWDSNDGKAYMGPFTNGRANACAISGTKRPGCSQAGQDYITNFLYYIALAFPVLMLLMILCFNFSYKLRNCLEEYSRVLKEMESARKSQQQQQQMEPSNGFAARREVVPVLDTTGLYNDSSSYSNSPYAMMQSTDSPSPMTPHSLHYASHPTQYDTITPIAASHSPQYIQPLYISNPSNIQFAGKEE